MRHLGNLTVTKENANDFPAVAEIYGHLTIEAGAHLVAPSLTAVRGWVTLKERSGRDYVTNDQAGELTALMLGAIDGWLTLGAGTDLVAPHLTRIIQDVTVGKDVLFEAVELEKIGGLILQRDARLSLPALTEIYGSLALAQHAELTAPLKTVGKSITLREGARLVAVELGHIGGYYDADPSAVLVAPRFVA